jgi:hypothetical protein
MVALTITAANMIPGTGAVFKSGQANAAIAVGKSCYLDTTTGFIGLYDGDGASADIRTLLGVCVAKAEASGGQCVVQIDGQLAFGAILTKGVCYIGGATAAGDINPIADITTNWQIGALGSAISTSVLEINIFNTGVVV